jgi:hypothetical protein
MSPGIKVPGFIVYICISKLFLVYYNKPINYARKIKQKCTQTLFKK